MAANPRSIRPGSNVFGSQGAYVGSVRAAGERAVRVVGSSPGNSTYCIPLSSIAGEFAPGELVLDCTIAELRSRGWQCPWPETRGCPIRPGAQVYARHGTYIGAVESSTEDVMRVRAGGPDTAVYHVPADAIFGQLGGGREVFIDCSIDELPGKGWLARR